MPSQSPSAAYRDGALASAGNTTLTFKLSLVQSSTLLADRGLADVHKIFGVRATIEACKDAAGFVEVSMAGSNHYAVLAHHWVLARVAPGCVIKFHLSSANFRSIFGAKQQKLVELQHQSCCYAAEHPRGSGHLILQGSHLGIADAMQWLSHVAASKHLEIDFSLGHSLHHSSAAPLRHLTPFQSHAIQLRSSPAAALSSFSDATLDNYVGAPSSPASITKSSYSLAANYLTSSNSKSPPIESRFSLHADVPLSKSPSISPPPLPLLKQRLDKKCPAPIIIDGESVALTHGKGYFFSTRGLQLVYDWFARRGHDCVIVLLPERLEAHPNAQHPPLIDSDVLQSLNTSGALVTDADPVSRILHLAQRCSLRERSAVIISRKTVFNRPSQPVTELPEGKDCHSASQFSVLSFHISGSSFAILPKLPTDATATIDSILMPSQNNERSSVFALSPILVSSKQKPVTPLPSQKSALPGFGHGARERGALLRQTLINQPVFCKTNAPRQTALHVLPICFGKDALDLVCDPSVWL